MSDKLNCWEFKNCGREPGGLLAARYGVCPVARAYKYDGRNDGQAAGRACWLVPRRFEHANRRAQIPTIAACRDCAFFRRVQFELEANAADPTISAPFSINK